MLIEVWNDGRTADVYVPADPANYPDHCRRIDDGDWRYLARLQGRRRGTEGNSVSDAPFAQDHYRIDAAALQAALGEHFAGEGGGAG